MPTDSNRADELYEMGMDIARRRIEKFPFYICVLMKGRENEECLLKQSEHAKSLGKAFYAIAEKGADIGNLNGASIRGIFYYHENEQESLEKSVERASKEMFEQVRKDFPEVESMMTALNRKANGVVRLQPRG